jgi:hypothetical protein
MLATIQFRTFCLLSKNLKMETCRTIIVTFGLDGCETGSLALREGHKLRVFEKRVLRRLFGPKTNKETG